MSQPNPNSTLASVVLGRLIHRWLTLTTALPTVVPSTQETDRLALAAVLLAHESAQLVRGAASEDVNKCLEVSHSGPWANLDEIPWLLIQGYVTNGKGDAKVVRRVERMLSHDSSSVRAWFHYVAWMIRADLNVKEVRPRLLQNLADKLGAVMESGGLLAVLHPDKAELDSAADAFQPREFGDQYRNRLTHIRESQWNSQTFNLWLAENASRKLIWDEAKALEVAQR